MSFLLVGNPWGSLLLPHISPLKSLLPPKLVTGLSGTIVGIDYDDKEPSWHNRPSIAEEGCVLLRYMPKCIYVLFPGSNGGYLMNESDSAPKNIAVSQLDVNWRDVVAIEPITETWTHKTMEDEQVQIQRRQFAFLLAKLGTLHGVQGKTAKPGLVAHWKFPKRLSKERLWLAHHVILSRPTSLENLVSNGLPDRNILEAGPPEELLQTFDRLFGDKIKKSKEAAIEARRTLGWPSRI